MDERIFRAKIGYPIPAWDASHRLPISGCVGPEVSDSATIFRINSTYMEVSDQPHMMRHWLAGGALMSFLTAILFLGVGLNVFISTRLRTETLPIYLWLLYLLYPL